MSVRDYNLDAIGALLATFKVKQTAGSDDLTDDDIGNAVTISADNEIGPGSDGDLLLGKLIDLTLEDGNDGDRIATVQIGGVCSLPTTSSYPTVGERLVCGTSGAVKQAPALTGNDPAGGNVARGTVLSVNGTTDCVVLLN